MLRMGFGTGRFRRTKYIFVHWSGYALAVSILCLDGASVNSVFAHCSDAVEPLKRGKANSYRRQASEYLAPWSIDMSATSLDQITVEEVIDKVRRATRVDGGDEESKERDPLSIDAFMDALKEEQEANAAFFGDDDVDMAAGMELPTALKNIHDHDGFLNWLIFEAKE